MRPRSQGPVDKPTAELERLAVVYPESDGRPVAETDPHRDVLFETVASVDEHFASVPDIYVSGNLLIYYEEGDLTKRFAPDFFLVRGVPKRKRRVYKVWEEGKGPDVVIEITSKSSRREDQGDKRGIYEELGVEEYFLFDPTGDWLEPILKGFRLREGVFEPMAPPRREEELLVLESKVLGLELLGREGDLRLRDPRTGELLPVRREYAARLEEERRAREEEHRRAEAEKQRAEAEKQRAEAAEAEVARLRAELSRRRGKREG
jgi:hypothetical protein